MNRNRESNRLLIGIIGGAALIVLTMITAIFMVSRRPVVVIVPSGAGAPGAVAPPVGMPPGANAGPAAAAAMPIPEISISKVAVTPTTDDPLDPQWEKVATVEVDLAPQQVASPGLEKGSISKLRIQAIHDDKRYVWRLSWDKPEIADTSDVAQFTDAVAMQFPLADGAPYTMGGPGMPVRMLYWKAIWQKDVDKGFQGLAGIHPNTDADLYWFSKGEREHDAAGSVDNPQAKQFMVAAQSGNPMVDLNRKSPIEELTAHGFGSSTHVPDSPSRGRGAWKDGKWYVVFDRPIDTKDPLIARFNSTPDKQLIAFAVWDGTGGNRGGRKQITNWLPMRITL
jgi:hypothetical protein